MDDEATRMLMGRLYKSMLRTESPLSPGDALREASLWLREWRDADGKQRYAAPRYWAAFVCYSN